MKMWSEDSDTKAAFNISLYAPNTMSVNNRRSKNYRVGFFPYPVLKLFSDVIM